MSKFDLEDVLAIEGEAESEEDYYLSLQRAINSGMWSLQGSYGRSMMDAINGGQCLLGEKGAKDYWGNYIPARDEVKPGTKGSAGFVRERMGAEWLEMMGGA
jgi:hypothetical protein